MFALIYLHLNVSQQQHKGLKSKHAGSDTQVAFGLCCGTEWHFEFFDMRY